MVCWDADYRYLDLSDGAVSTQSKPLEAQGEFENRRFSGAKLQNFKKPERQLNFKNTYGVLLPRAHQGMIICVPRGDTKVPTRLPAFYEPIANYLADCGIKNFIVIVSFIIQALRIPVLLAQASHPAADFCRVRLPGDRYSRLVPRPPKFFLQYQ